MAAAAALFGLLAGPSAAVRARYCCPRPAEAAGVLEARWAPSRGLCWHLAPLTGAWRHARGQHTSDMRARVPSHGSILYTGASEASRGLYCSAVVDSFSGRFPARMSSEIGRSSAGHRCRTVVSPLISRWSVVPQASNCLSKPSRDASIRPDVDPTRPDPTRDAERAAPSRAACVCCLFVPAPSPPRHGASQVGSTRSARRAEPHRMHALAPMELHRRSSRRSETR
eukprot:365237-Prymnesium_polylepis.1